MENYTKINKMEEMRNTIKSINQQANDLLKGGGKMTDKEYKREVSKRNRDYKKQIESILHPLPVVGDAEICHEHLRSGKIRFSAWRRSEPANKNMKEFLCRKEEVINYGGDFYTVYSSELEWLTMGEE